MSCPSLESCGLGIGQVSPENEEDLEGSVECASCTSRAKGRAVDEGPARLLRRCSPPSAQELAAELGTEACIVNVSRASERRLSSAPISPSAFG